MKPKKVQKQPGRVQAPRWFYSRSALHGQPFKKIPGFEAWFYTGPSEFFGHPNDIKKNRG